MRDSLFARLKPRIDQSGLIPGLCFERMGRFEHTKGLTQHSSAVEVAWRFRCDPAGRGLFLWHFHRTPSALAPTSARAIFVATSGKRELTLLFSVLSFSNCQVREKQPERDGAGRLILPGYSREWRLDLIFAIRMELICNVWQRKMTPGLGRVSWTL